ncbi:MAG: hypothetical protein ABIP78_11530 [Pyrinomonadaceae bacterium]
MKLAAISVGLLMLLTTVNAQDLPKKIRGYKVYNAKVSVVNSTTQAANNENPDALVKFGEPTIAGIGFSGAIIEIAAEITSAKQNGQVEFVTFRDICINNTAIEIEEYKHPFTFNKGKPVILPKPIRVSISLTSLSKAAYHELFQSGDKLKVTGTAFVFGKFKKFGFRFKRVVPIKIELTIRNPIRS